MAFKTLKFTKNLTFNLLLVFRFYNEFVTCKSTYYSQFHYNLWNPIWIIVIGITATDENNCDVSHQLDWKQNGFALAGYRRPVHLGNICSFYTSCALNAARFFFLLAKCSMMPILLSMFGIDAIALRWPIITRCDTFTQLPMTERKFDGSGWFSQQFYFSSLSIFLSALWADFSLPSCFFFLSKIVFSVWLHNYFFFYFKSKSEPRIHRVEDESPSQSDQSIQCPSTLCMRQRAY